MKWIEITDIHPYQQVMQVLTGDENMMTRGCIDGNMNCIINVGESLTASQERFIYAWIEEVLD